MIPKNTYYPANRKEWRKWLSINHSIKKEIWVIYYKKHTLKPRVPYNAAVEEALCYGWIDSTVKRIDEERYCQKFTPRNIKSVWSDLNKERVKKLIEAKKMTRSGLTKIEAAKENGKWDEEYLVNKNNPIPKIFKDELNNHSKAKVNFENLPPSHKKHYINWIIAAKKNETKLRRCNKAIEMLNDNKRMGM